MKCYEEYVKREYGIPYLDFTGLDITVKDAFVNSLEVVFEKFPALKNTICAIGNLNIINNQINLIGNADVDFDDIHWRKYVSEEKECILTYSSGYILFRKKIDYIAIGFGDKIMNKTVDKINEAITKQTQKLYHPRHFTEFNCMVYHEIGHILEQILKLRKDKALLKIISKETKGFSTVEIVGKISSYAVESIEELIAEAFAEYMLCPESNSLIYAIGRYIEYKYQKYEDSNIFNINSKYGTNLVKSDSLNLKLIQKD